MAFLKWIRISNDCELHLKGDDENVTSIKDARIKRKGKKIKKLNNYEGAIADWAFSDCPSGIIRIRDK